MTVPPSDMLVTRWLQDNDARLAAWGAHAVLAGERSGLLPLVEETIAQWETEREARPGLWDFEHADGMIAMLDTVIQMDGTLPAETLAKMEGMEAGRVVLLLRLPWDEVGPVWQTLYRPEMTTESAMTRVAAEVLAEHPTPGFAADLLGRITVFGHVVVTNPQWGMAMGGGIGSVGDCGRSAPAPANWPDVGSYVLQDLPKQTGATRLLDGPPPVYLVREVTRSYYPDICGGFSSLTDGMRDQLVGTMLQQGIKAPLELTPELQFEFDDAEAYRRQVVGFVRAQQVAFERVVAGMVSRGVMTEEERRRAALRIQLRLDDVREPGGVELPKIVFQPPVEWVLQGVSPKVLLDQ